MVLRLLKGGVVFGVVNADPRPEAIFVRLVTDSQEWPTHSGRFQGNRFHFEQVQQRAARVVVTTTDGRSGFKEFTTASPDEVVVELQAGSFVSGRLLKGMTQVPASFVRLSLEKGPFAQTAWSDEDGRFQFGPLSEGDYVVEVDLERLPSMQIPAPRCRAAAGPGKCSGPRFQAGDDRDRSGQ